MRDVQCEKMVEEIAHSILPAAGIISSYQGVETLITFWYPLSPCAMPEDFAGSDARMRERE